MYILENENIYILNHQIVYYSETKTFKVLLKAITSLKRKGLKKMNKIKLNNYEKDLIKFAKKWLCSGDIIKTTQESYNYTIGLNDNMLLRFFSERTGLLKYQFNDNTNKWSVLK